MRHSSPFTLSFFTFWSFFTFLALLLSACGVGPTTTVNNNVGDSQWSGLNPGQDAIIIVSNHLKSSNRNSSVGLFWKHNTTGDILLTNGGAVTPSTYRVAPGSYTIKHFEFESGRRKYSGSVPGNITFTAKKGKITYVGHVDINATGRISASVRNISHAARKVVGLKDKSMVSKIKIRLAH